MPAEIKFKGKKVRDRQWVYGDLIQSRNPNRSIKDAFILPVDETDVTNYFEVFPETVSQYINLKDKNHKEIYQGDIYLATRSYMPSRGYKKKGYPDKITVICVVEWSTYDGGWVGREISPIKEHIIFDKNAPYHYYHTSLSGAPDGNADWVEVIGNIHENKELLKKHK